MPLRSRRTAALLSAAAIVFLLGACGRDSGSGVEPPRAPRIVTDSLAVGAAGIPYAVQLEAVEGDGSYQWEVVAGPLPPGLALDPATGLLAGVPASGATTHLAIGVTSAALADTASFPITVFDALGIATTDFPTGVEGAAYAATVEVEGGDGAPTFGVVSGGLPPGLALDSVTGRLEGVPSALGVSYFTVRAWNPTGQVAERPYAVAVHPRLSITTADLPGGQVGSTYRQTLASTGGAGRARWSVVAGALPRGLTLGQRGAITGVPTEAGPHDFTVQVETDDGQTDTAALTLEVSYPRTQLPPAALPPATVQTAYATSLVATGGDGQYHFERIAGTLPTGLTLAPDGRITGVPLAEGRWDFIARATSAGTSESRAFSILVVADCVLPDPEPGFNIHLCYQNPPSPSAQAAFANAVARWESIIVGDLASAPANPLAATQCLPGRVLPTLTGIVDDLVIHVVIEPIDGVQGVLGSAGPCFVRNSNSLPTIGVMLIDSADIDHLAATGQLEEVLVHEMGHVLGIGTVWLNKSLLQNPSRAGVMDPTLYDTHFSGFAAVAAFDAAGGAARTGARVPVQNVGYGGAINGHWRESVLGHELMTPFLTLGIVNPLSAISIASLADLGYQVDLGQADPYTVPFPLAPVGAETAGRPAAPRIELVGDILELPVHVVDERGEVVRVVHPGRQ